MYGETRMNAHHILRYGFTIQFLRQFRLLSYEGIEMPNMFIRPFHVFIGPIVDSLITHRATVHKLQKSLGLRSIADVQKALYRVPKPIRNLSVYPHRRAILLPARMVAFAVERLKDHPVILVDYAAEDKRHLEKFSTLPSHFSVFDFKKEVANTSVPEKLKKRYRKMVAKMVKSAGRHPVFSNRNFEPWLFRHALLGYRYMNVLSRLVRQQPIGIMIDTAEIINPAATLVLLARKYGLPFVTAPHVLITDRTFIPARATHFFVWGEHYRRWMMKRGIPSARIHVVGNVRMDQLMQRPVRNRSEWMKELNLPPNIPLVAVATQPFPEVVQNQVVRWLKQVADADLPFIYLLKPHPYDRYDYSVFQRHPRVRVLKPQDHSNELLTYCDILATISSNMGIEAARFKKPVLVLQPKIPYMYEFNNNLFNAHLALAKAGPVIRNPAGWIQVLKRFAEDKDYRNRLVEQSQLFLQRTIYMGRPAAELTAEMIFKLLKK